MYALKSLENYKSEPWELSFSERVAKVYETLRKKKRLAIMLYRAADTSTFRYRCYNVMQYAEQSTQWGSVYFFENEMEQLSNLLEKASLLIVTRMKWSFKLQGIVVAAKARGTKVLFDVDDMVVDLNILPLLINTLNVDIENDVAYDFWFAYIARLQQAAGMADGFITTNNFLGEALQKKFGRPFGIIPNTLNREQLNYSRALRKEKEQKKSSKRFTIGYFSGTPSHINDFLLIHQEIIELLKRHCNIRLLVVGFMEFPKEMQPYLENGQVVFQSLVDFIELQRLMAQVDINIVPLVSNRFTNCKSELKFFEAAAVNTLTVATPIYTYAKCIRDGQNGFLCKQGQWYEVLENIYQNRYDLDALQKQALKDALDTYSGANIIAAIDQTYSLFADPEIQK